MRLAWHGGFERPPLERGPHVQRLFALAREAGETIGLDVREGATGGASDGNFTAALGVPTLDGLGANGDGAHARHEHVEIASLPDRAALAAAILLAIDAHVVAVSRRRLAQSDSDPTVRLPDGDVTVPDRRRPQVDAARARES